MILDRLTTLRKSKTSIQREGQVRQGCLSVCAQSFARMRNQKSTHRHSPYKLLNTKIRHLSKQRILYIQFSALVKSNARMFNCGDNTHRDRLFRTILCLALNLPPLSKGGGLTAKQKPLLCCICLRYIRLFLFTKLFCRQDGGIASVAPTSPSPQPLQKDNNPSPHICPFIQYVNHSPVCSSAHSSAFGTASPQDRYKVPK